MSVTIAPLTVEETSIRGLLMITSKAVTDERGTVQEFFRASDFEKFNAAMPPRWSQVNLTYTQRGGLRGLHGEATDKLVGVAHGEAFGVYLDARPDSPTFRTVETRRLIVGVQLFVPAGVCNGFQAVSDGGCMYLYCLSNEWQPGMAGVAVNPLDPDLGINWPITPDAADPAMVSARDAEARRFADL